MFLVGVIVEAFSENVVFWWGLGRVSGEACTYVNTLYYYIKGNVIRPSLFAIRSSSSERGKAGLGTWLFRSGEH